MTVENKLSAPKRRTRAEVQTLVAEFVSNIRVVTCAVARDNSQRLRTGSPLKSDSYRNAERRFDISQPTFKQVLQLESQLCLMNFPFFCPVSELNSVSR